MPTSSPRVAQLEFSVRIRERRKELGLDAKTVSGRMGFSRNYYSAVENNRTILADDRVSELAEILELDESTTTEMADLARVARRSGWWDDYSNLLDESSVELWALEDGAYELDIVETNVVTGLLQTEDYSRAIIGADPRISVANERRFVESRRRRQQRLWGEDPVSLRVVLSEAAIMQEIGGPLILRQQLEYLLELVESMDGRLDLRLAPFSATSMINASTLVLMKFRSSYLPAVIWREAGSAIESSGGEELVDIMSLLIQRTRGTSLSPAETIGRIEERVAALREREDTG